MTWTVDQVIHDRYQLMALKRDRPGHQVWLAYDQKSQIKVILKTLAFTGEISWDEVKLFEQEVEVVKRLQHPRTPAFVDAFSQDRPTFRKCLVESYIQAPSLQAFLDRKQSIPPSEVWAIATQLLTILRDLHGLSPPLLHRDLKPSNILIDAQKRIYLIDLGSVRIQPTSTQAESSPTTVGSYGYTPEEQFMGQAVPASDLYALGATLMQLLTATHPAELMNSSQRLVLPLKPEIAAPLRQWLLMLTEPNLAYRTTTATQALQGLQVAQTQAVKLAKTASRTAPPRLAFTDNPLKLAIHPVWNQSSMATQDLLFLTALGLLPPILGFWWAIATLGRLHGFGLFGTDLLILSLAVLPTTIIAPKLFWNLLEQSIVGTSSELRIQRKIAGITIQQRTLKLSNIRSIHLTSQSPEFWRISAKNDQNQDQAIVLRLKGSEADATYLALEQWLNRGNQMGDLMD